MYLGKTSDSRIKQTRSIFKDYYGEDVQMGIDYAEGGEDKTVLTVAIIKEAVEKLQNVVTNFNSSYSCSIIHPFQLHWIHYSGYLGTTNSKRKFRHRNYIKALKMCKRMRRGHIYGS